MRTSSPVHQLRPAGLSLAALGIGVVLLVGCAEPERPTDVEPDAVVSEDPIEEPDDREELLAQLSVLRDSLDDIRAALSEVSEAGSVGEAQLGVDRALANLVVQHNGTRSDTNGPDDETPPDGNDDATDEGGDADADDAVADDDATDEGGNADADDAATDEDAEGGTQNEDSEAAGTEPASALLPSQTLDRSESASSPDLLSATMTQAGDVGGDLGRDIAEVLRDPIAGDLGAWQRDPAGMVALAERVATSSTDLSSLETAIRELDGEGTRALAWTFVAQGAVADDDLELAQGAAQRALAHVQIMLVAVEDVGGWS